MKFKFLIGLFSTLILTGCKAPITTEGAQTGLMSSAPFLKDYSQIKYVETSSEGLTYYSQTIEINLESGEAQFIYRDGPGESGTITDTVNCSANQQIKPHLEALLQKRADIINSGGFCPEYVSSTYLALQLPADNTWIKVECPYDFSSQQTEDLVWDLIEAYELHCPLFSTQTN